MLTAVPGPATSLGEIVECRHGIKLFAGQRRDPFYNFIPFPVAATVSVPTVVPHSVVRPALL